MKSKLESISCYDGKKIINNIVVYTNFWAKNIIKNKLQGSKL